MQKYCCVSSGNQPKNIMAASTKDAARTYCLQVKIPVGQTVNVQVIPVGEDCMLLTDFIDWVEVKHGWIGVDFDGTLATHCPGQKSLGEPIAPMVEQVEEWLLAGEDVRIFTARASELEDVEAIRDWCRRVFGTILPVTNVKDQNIVALWDDKAVSVIKNTGFIRKT